MSVKHMMATPKPSYFDKELVRQALSFEQLASHYGLETFPHDKVRCPFHGKDHRPSATIKGGFFHCFVCNESLDVFVFIQRMENCNFQEAVTIGAELAGVKATEAPRKLARIISERKHGIDEKKRVEAASDAKYHMLTRIAMKARPFHPDWITRLDGLLDVWARGVPEDVDLRPIAVVYSNGGSLDALKPLVIRLCDEWEFCHE